MVGAIIIIIIATATTSSTSTIALYVFWLLILTEASTRHRALPKLQPILRSSLQVVPSVQETGSSYNPRRWVSGLRVLVFSVLVFRVFGF